MNSTISKLILGLLLVSNLALFFVLKISLPDIGGVSNEGDAADRPRIERVRSANVQMMSSPAVETGSIDSIHQEHALRGVTKMKNVEVQSRLRKPSSIAIVGERSSGTTWIHEDLNRCFGKHRVRAMYYRWKHWFQESFEGKKSFGYEMSDTIPIVMVRNPYDWLWAMHNRPYHSPNHLRLSVHDFLTSPWTMKRPVGDETGPQCQTNFTYHQVIPCREGTGGGVYSSNWPCYELAEGGKPFENIISLRAAKLKNFYGMKSWAPNLIHVRYEDLLTGGTESLISRLESMLGIKRLEACKVSPPQSHRLHRYHHSDEFLRIVNLHVDWETEKLFSYKKGA